jgi:hypothetical protein
MKYGICTNQPDQCRRAAAREAIEMPAPDTRCPDCGKPLLPAPGTGKPPAPRPSGGFAGSGGTPALPWVIAGCAVAALGVALIFRMISGPSLPPPPPPNPGKYCSVPGLKPSLRHTYLLIDQRLLSQASTAADFIERNKDVHEVVMTFADPANASKDGPVDWREALTVYALPLTGDAPVRVFSGCVPALTPVESSNERGQFFNSLQKDQDEWRKNFDIALVTASEHAASSPAKREGRDRLANTNVLSSLRAADRLIESDGTVPRIVLLSNLANLDPGLDPTPNGARDAAFRDARVAGVNLGFSELHVFTVQNASSEDARNSALARSYFEAFVLRSNAFLATWAQRPSSLPLAPVTVEPAYVGTLEIPTSNGPHHYPVEVRIAADRTGHLVNSWMILLESESVAGLPMSGTWTCEDADPAACRGVSDGSRYSFGQAWAERNAIPQFKPVYPLGGARNWDLTLKNSALTGEVTEQDFAFAPGDHHLPLSAKPR